MVVFLAGTYVSDLSVVLATAAMNRAFSKRSHSGQRVGAMPQCYLCGRSERALTELITAQGCCEKCLGDKDLLCLPYHQMLTQESKVRVSQTF